MVPAAEMPERLGGDRFQYPIYHSIQPIRYFVGQARSSAAIHEARRKNIFEAVILE